MKDHLAAIFGLALAVMMTAVPIPSDAMTGRMCTLRGHLVVDDRSTQGVVSHYSLRRTIGPSGRVVDLAIVATDASQRHALDMAHGRDAEVEIYGNLTTAGRDPIPIPILILESIKEIQ